MIVKIVFDRFKCTANDDGELIMGHGGNPEVEIWTRFYHNEGDDLPFFHDRKWVSLGDIIHYEHS